MSCEASRKASVALPVSCSVSYPATWSPFTAEAKNMWELHRHGRAVTQAVSRRLLTAEAQVQYLVSPSGICGGQSGTGTGFSPSTSVFPCQFNSTGAPLLMIFITRLHNKPQGCGASVASAAGPATTHTKTSPTLPHMPSWRGT
jgi:hypothetical protein